MTKSLASWYATFVAAWCTCRWRLCLGLGLLASLTTACTAEESQFLSQPVTPIAFQVPTPLVTTEAEQETSGVAPDQETGDAEESLLERDTITEPAVEFVIGPETGFAEEGFPYIGSATAPIVVVEFSDFHCPYCRRHNQETFPQFRENFIDTGLVQYIAKDLPLESLHPQARKAHRAAWCVALQDTTAFWWMHSQLYATQAQHARAENTPAFFETLVATYNATLPEGQGLDIQAFMACQQDFQSEVDQQIDRAIAEARSLDITGTPTFLIYYRDDPDRVLPISGAYEYEVFEDVANHLDQYLDRMEEEAAAPVELPYWISEEGLMPAQMWKVAPETGSEDTKGNWEGVTRAQDHFKGSPVAQVLVFEFSDFQCPYCQRHQETTQPALDEAYVNTGKIMWIYKHFPLAIHDYAPDAAEAAMCAGEQGQFWAMHDRLFVNPDAWAHADFLGVFLDFGRDLTAEATIANRHEVRIPSPLTDNPADWELSAMTTFDLDQFETCLADNDYQALINRSMEDVSGVVRGTPTFLVWHRRYGLLTQPLVGTLSEEDFVSIFDQIFEQLAELEGSDP